MSVRFAIEPLAKTHKRADFTCGNDRIDAQLSRSETLADERGLGGDSGGDQAQKSRAA